MVQNSGIEMCTNGNLCEKGTRVQTQTQELAIVRITSVTCVRACACVCVRAHRAASSRAPVSSSRAAPCRAALARAAPAPARRAPAYPAAAPAPTCADKQPIQILSGKLRTSCVEGHKIRIQPLIHQSTNVLLLHRKMIGLR